MPGPPLIEYFPLLGGVDEASAPLAVQPGRIRNCLNFEIAKTGKGYRYPEGYERYDGQLSPSGATYTRIDFSVGLAGISTGDVVDGSVSGAQGVALVDGVVETGSYVSNDATGYIVLLVTSGTFTAADQLEVAAATKCDADTVHTAGTGAANQTTDDAWVALAYTEAWGNIAAVPGTGDILGVHRYKSVTYAFRNNAGDTATDMYKSTTGGWSKVDLGNVLNFDAGTAAFVVGETVTGAGFANATINKVVVTSGSWDGNDAAGFFILGTIAAGPYVDDEVLTGSIAGAATANGANSANAITKDGKFECINHNFGGHSGTLTMYGVNGVGKAFEYDGTAFSFITTGMTTDTPNHIAAHQGHLFLSFDGGSVQHSSLVSSPLTAPHVWSAVTGAAEFGMGDDVTGFAQTAGETLTIYCKNRTKILYGESLANWNLQDHSDTAGAREWTIQKLNEPFYVDSNNLTSLRATQVYGGLSASAISADIQDFMDTHYGNEVASAIKLDKNQYILFYSDDSYLTMTITNEGLAGHMFGQLYDTPTCACYDDDSGEVFFGSDDGFVYEMYKGTSHDMETIVGYMQLPFNFFKTPYRHKKFYKIIFEMDTETASSINFKFFPTFDYMNSGIPQDTTGTINFSAGTLIWDVGEWDVYNWDGDSDSYEEPEGYINGIASEMAINIYLTSTTQEPFTLNGVFIKYSPMGEER